MTDEFKVEKYQGGEQIVFDPTSLLRTRCLEAYRLGVVEGYRLPIEGEHLSFGKAMHQVLLEPGEIGSYHDTLSRTGDRGAALDAAVRFACENFAKMGSEKAKFSLTSLLMALIWYDAQFGEVDTYTTALHPDGRPILEERFEVPLYGKYRLSGRVDRVVVDDSGFIMPADFKTTDKSLTAASWFDKFNLHMQMMLYVWALHRQLKLCDPFYMIEAVQTGATMSRCVRWPVEVKPHMLDMVEEFAIRRVKQVEAAHRGGIWPRDLAQCDMFFGCEFIPICAAAPDERPKLLAGRFAKTR